MGLGTPGLGLTAPKQPAMPACSLWWWGQQSESCAVLVVMGVWFHDTEHVWSQEVLRWTSVRLGCRVVLFGPQSTIVEVPEAIE